MERVLLVELDALLDSRFGLLKQIGLTNPDEVKVSKQYRMRIADDFSWCGVSDDDFTNRYKKRNVTTLLHSQLTILAAQLQHIVRQYEEMICSNNPAISGLKLMINTYPYVLEEDEEAEIVRAVKTQSNLNLSASCVRYSPAMINPNQLGDLGVVCYVVYNFEDWLTGWWTEDKGYTEDNHPVNLELLVLIPKLTLGKSLVEELDGMLINEHDKMDYWHGIVQAFLFMFQLEFLPVTTYSVIDLTLIDKAEEQMTQINNERPEGLDVQTVYEINQAAGKIPAVFNWETVEQQYKVMESEIGEFKKAIAERDLDKLRDCIFDARFVVNNFATCTPFNLMDDFWDGIEGLMTRFDRDEENAIKTREKWVARGVPCETRTGYIKGERVLVCVATDDAVDNTCGDTISKNKWLKSHAHRHPVYKPLSPELYGDLIEKQAD